MVLHGCGEVGESAEQALDKIRSVLKDCGTDLSVSQAFLTGDDEDRYTKALQRFAEGIASLAKPPGREP